MLVLIDMENRWEVASIDSTGLPMVTVPHALDKVTRNGLLVIKLFEKSKTVLLGHDDSITKVVIDKFHIKSMSTGRVRFDPRICLFKDMFTKI